MPTKTNSKQLRSGNKNIHINNYVKYKWTKCSNQKIYTDWMDTETKDPYTCCLQEITFRSKDTYTRKVKGWEKVFTQMEITRKLE